MSNEFKDRNIINHPYYFFDNTNIKNFDPDEI